MDKHFILTENEEEILMAMWDSNSPMTRTNILNSIKGRKWRDTSFYGLLNSLMEKGAVVVSSIVKSGKSFGRTYIPTMSKEDYNLMQLEIHFEKINPSKFTLLKFLNNLIDNKEMSISDFSELKEK